MMPDAAIMLGLLALPLAVAAFLLPRRSRDVALALAPWAPLPALVVAILGAPAGPVVLPWLLLGTELGLDHMRRVFLLFTAGLWLAVGLYGAKYHREDRRRARLFAFHLVTLTGNLGVVLALDAVSFYLFFIVLSFAAFGLIIHAGTQEARRAALVYLVLVIVGEALILPGLWLAVTHAPSPGLSDVSISVGELGMPVMLLLAAGFGIKAGLAPLHVWLPLAHPVAPTPSSAVLSGAIIKAGLLGWLVFLPLGGGAFRGFADLLVAVGLLSAFYGAVIGVMQLKPKTVLAYSSISQMGLVALGVGAGLSGEAAWPAARAAILAYALHHALAKGALFLGVGVVENAARQRARRWALGFLFLPALALAGAPLTSGIVAKTTLKTAAYELTGATAVMLDWLLPLTAVGTTVLMARFLWLMAHASAQGRHPGLWAPWLALLIAVATVSWLPIAVTVDTLRESLTLAAAWEAAWPMALGAGLALLAAGPWRRRLARVPRVREVDLLWPALALGRPVFAYRPKWALDALLGPGPRMPNRMASAEPRLRATLQRHDRALMRWTVFAPAALLALLIAVALLAM